EPAQAKSLREIAQNRRVRQRRRRTCLGTVVYRMIDFVHDELDSPIGGEVMQRQHLGVRQRRTCWIVRRVNQNEFRILISLVPYLVEVDAKLVLGPQMIKSGLDS